MLIAIGSTNVVKVQAVEELVKEYPKLQNARIVSLSVPSEISAQPITMDETIQGAKNRARNAFKACQDCSYSFGIESGLFEAPGAQTGFLNVCVCCIYNGQDFHIGFSTGFEVPAPILHYITEHKMDLSQACVESGITNNTHIGSSEGLIGILTKGRVNRKDYTKESVATALIQLENTDWYYGS
jgi:inosine/xanthosine triphosphatase